MRLQWRLLGLLMAGLLVLGVAGCGPAEEPAPANEGEANVEAPNEAADEGAMDDEAPAEDEAAEEDMGQAMQVPDDTYVAVTIGEPESLDPAWTYETSGAAVESNLYEGLVYFDRGSADDFVPALATDWEMSEDGLTYTFNVRDGVTFHQGGTLEPHDIAYSMHRAMLQDRVDGPMWLFLEPLLGVSSIEALALEEAGLDTDVAEGEEAPTLDDVGDDVAVSVCETIKETVVADDEAGTVTITVQQPTPWLLQLLAQPWGAALDMEWMVEQGDWDGSCEGWREWHSPSAEGSTLFNAANGTGPYMLGEWKPGQEITLEANEDYWRTEPVWDGGPSGPPALKHIVIQTVDEWGTRFAKLQAGEADTVSVPRAEINQVEDMIHTRFEGGNESAPSEVVNEDGTLKLFVGYPLVSATAAMFNFDISTEGENQFIGSGQLDGEGIPPDFFSDINVRRGFSYCFDWDTLIADALQGEGIQTRGPIIQGLQGHSEDSEIYTYDLEQCASELEEAWDGQVAENGFKMTLAYNEGNDTRRTAAEILAENLSLVDERYVVDVVSLEWPSFLDARRGRQLPISVSGWLEDYHDASNWVHPFMHSAGAYSRAQSFPDEMQSQFDELIAAGVQETDEAARDEIYTQLQQLAIENAIDIFLFQATGRFYVNRDVEGWFYHPLRPGTWYYALSKSSS